MLLIAAGTVTYANNVRDQLNILLVSVVSCHHIIRMVTPPTEKNKIPTKSNTTKYVQNNRLLPLNGLFSIIN